MNILIHTLLFHPRVGGIEQRTALMARAFAAAGHSVTLATPVAHNAPHDDGFGNAPYRLVRAPSAAALARLVRASDVMVQMNVSLKYLWTRALGTPVLTFHANAYCRDDGTRSLKDTLKRFVARRTPGIANSRYTGAAVGCRTVIPNPYDDATLRITRPRTERPNDLVFLGRLVSQKGVDVLIDALAHLKRREGTAPALTVIGDGPERAALETQAMRAGLCVRFAGTLCGTALCKALNAHRVMVVPSRYHEPFGIVALEGLATGLLPVVSAHGGLTDAIGPHGLTVPNADAAALADAIHTALSDPAAQNRLDGVEAHLSRHSREAIAARYLAVLESVARSRHSRTRTGRQVARG